MNMQKQILALTIIMLAISCTTARQVTTAQNSLRGEIEQIYHKGYFKGFAVSIVNAEGPLYEQGFGFSDTAQHKKYSHTTIQNIASISKTFVGIALLKAKELGKLNLEDPIEKYLPFKVINPHFPEEKITIKQLATHTSSVTDNAFYLQKNYYLKAGQDLKNLKLNFDDEQIFNPSDSIMSMDSFLKNMLATDGKWNRNSFLNNKPGTFYEYSNMGTALAAYIVEMATGEPFNEFTQKHILGPLKMHQSGWKFQDIKFSKFSTLFQDPKTPLPFYEMITYPDGGLITSVSDLGKFLSELIRGYNGKGTILSNSSYKEYFQPQLSASNFKERNEQNPYSESYNVGLFIGYGYTGYIGHTGGDPGTLSMMFFDPKKGTGRIMVFNTNFSDKQGNDAFYGIWNLLEKYEGKF